MKKIVGLLILGIVLIYACGPTLESSQKSWDNNLKAIEKLKAELPVFTLFIEQKLADAKKAWNEAKSISDEEARLNKMVEANNILSGGTLGNLRNMKNKIAEVKKKEGDILKQNIPDTNLLARADKARLNAQTAVQKAQDLLSISQAEFDVNNIASKIDFAYQGLNDAINEIGIIANLIRDTNNKIKEEKNKKEQEIKAAQQKEEKAKADIKCEYCGTMNKPDRTNCKSCGAPLPKNK